MRFAVPAIVLTLTASAPLHAATYTFLVDQLTSGTAGYYAPRVSGANVVWWGNVGGTSSSKREIFFHDGASTTQLTTNNYLDSDPEISGSHVAWWGMPDGTAATNREIFYFDGATAMRVTNDSVRDEAARISGGTVVWERGAGTAKEIGRSPGPHLTGNAVYDGQPSIAGSRVVWVSDSTPNNQIMLYDGATTTPIQASQYALEDPQASNTRVVWEGFKAGTTNDREIYQYDGANPNTPTNLSDNAFPDFDPQVSGETVVWWGGVFNDFQIYQYKDGAVAPISSGIRNQFPRIDGDFVVWQHFDGNDDEIYFWDGAAAVPLTNNNYNDTVPRISGNHIVWEATVGGGNQIMSALRALEGDANLDGVANGADYTIWADHFGQSGEFTEGDFNQDGKVDGADYTLWADNFTPAAAAAVPLPEPATGLLALMATATGAIVYRRLGQR